MKSNRYSIIKKKLKKIYCLQKITLLKIQQAKDCLRDNIIFLNLMHYLEI